MERLKERATVARRALQTFQEALKAPTPTSIDRDASIQRFEYTVEAVWRLAQRYLEVVEGIQEGSPKAAIRRCREVGLFDEESTRVALEMVDDRNLTVHTYNEPLAQRIYSRLPQYAVILESWVAKIESRLR